MITRRMLAGVLVFAGCTAAGEERITVVKDRKAAPGFHLQDASGKTVTLPDYRGKVVLLNFWATWCGGCKVELPWFDTFQKSYGPRRFAVLGVSMDENGWKAVKPFVRKTKLSMRMTLGDDVLAERYAVKSMPSTYLIDRTGRIAATYVGLVKKNEVEADIKAILSEK